MFYLIVVAVAVFIGVRSERARQAHQMWGSYKERLANMRGQRMKETMNALFGICALVVVVILITGIGG
jgi:predicted nucleic acid-binding Zn ribbon protein